MAVIAAAAAAPATSVVFLSAELMWESWAKSKQVRPRQLPGGSARWPTAASDIKVEGLDGKLFLVRADGDAIFHLYPVAGAVCGLLAEPLVKAEAAKLIHAAFPDADRRRLRRDILILFED
ncbi:hypothetical protein [Sinorhizobium meliloti]|uniref:hypothetical protein n=1 Tax=Rhizobium meliloti TaxID=382 RepID=UPI001F1BDD4A|nr:hypothetical protein [Sinorhizobium meliloti]